MKGHVIVPSPQKIVLATQSHPEESVQLNLQASPDFESKN